MNAYRKHCLLFMFLTDTHICDMCKKCSGLWSYGTTFILSLASCHTHMCAQTYTHLVQRYFATAVVIFSTFKIYIIYIL